MDMHFNLLHTSQMICDWFCDHPPIVINTHKKYIYLKKMFLGSYKYNLFETDPRLELGNL